MKFRETTRNSASLRFVYRSLFGVLLAVFTSGAAMAQTFSASIAGTVTDPSGAVVSGAKLTLKNTDTKDTRVATSAANGFYNFTNLLPGPYQITATSTGFKDYQRSNMLLRASSSATVNIPLEVGAAQQQVTVSGETVLLDTMTANNSVTMDQALIQSLPNSTLNPLNFVLDLAGTTEAQGGLYSRSQTYDQTSSSFGINGGRTGESEILVDGAPSTAVDWGGMMVSPINDSVQEQQVIMNTYDAQYERGAEGVVNLITKGGSDRFHGEVYDFLLNSSLNANTWSNDDQGLPKGKLHRNQFGANVGGYIWKSHHVYFFAAYEGLRQPQTTSSGLQTVPTALERTGDFSQSFNADGSPVIIYNPYSTRAATDNMGDPYYTRDEFPGDKVPATMIDKVGQAYMNLYPLPNRPGTGPNLINNYDKQGSASTSNDKFDWRVDWSPNATNRLFVRMTDRVRQNDTQPCYYCNGADTGFNNEDRGVQAVANDTYTPSPTLVVDVYGAYTRWFEGQTAQGYGAASASTVGLSPGLFEAPLLPVVGVQNYSGLGNGSYNRYVRYLSTGIVNVTKQLGNHSLKFGFNFDVNQINIRQDSAGSFNFDRNITSCDPVTKNYPGAVGPCVAQIQGTDTSGNGLAALLLGVGNGGSNINMDPAMSLHTYGMYLQDNWRATQKLTVTAGLRYENQRPATERHNRLAYFDKTAVNPISGAFGSPLPGQFEYARVDGRSRFAWQPDNLNFAPRLGLAYQVNDKVVIRAGSGLFYGPASAMLGYDNPGQFPGYTSQTNWFSTVGGTGYIPNPSSLLSNPFPNGLSQPTGNSQGGMTLVGNGASQIWPKGPHPIGQIYEWSVDLQYQVSSHSVAELGYTGVRGRKLLFGNPNFDLDQLPKADLAMGNALNDQVPNPFYGIITDPNDYLSNQYVVRNTLLRPYPEYTYLVQTRSLPGARSQFDALYAKYNHSFSNGLSAIVTYQWSKNMDDGSEALVGWTINDMWRDATNPKLDYAISTHDVPNSFAVAFTYQLPYGNGMRWGGTAPWLLRQTLGGWNLSGAVRLASGFPFPNPVQFSYNPIGNYGFPGPGLPDMISGVSARPAHRTSKHWINPKAFVGEGGTVCTLPNPACTPFMFKYGNEPQRYTDLREAPQKNVDLSVAKSFGPPRIRTQIRGDFLNVFNHPIYGGSYNISNCLDCGDLGTVYGTRNDPRQIQVAAKVTF